MGEKLFQGQVWWGGGEREKVGRVVRGQVGQIPDSLQGRTFANHRLDITP